MFVDASSKQCRATNPHQRSVFARANLPRVLPDLLFSMEKLTAYESTLLRFLAEPPTTNLSDLNRFKKIRKIFLKFNTILPSSAPVERLFSYVTMLNLQKYQITRRPVIRWSIRESSTIQTKFEKIRTIGNFALFNLNNSSVCDRLWYEHTFQ
ncbi:hypothetical protein TKK_0000146 [Trichogramma kaykai]